MLYIESTVFAQALVFLATHMMLCSQFVRGSCLACRTEWFHMLTQLQDTLEISLLLGSVL